MVGSPKGLICPGRCNRQIGFLLRWGCVARKPNRQSGRLEHPFRRYRWYLWWSYCRQMSTQILPTHSCKINDGPFSEFWGQGWSRTWTNPAVKTITRVLKQLSSVKNLQVRKFNIYGCSSNCKVPIHTPGPHGDPYPMIHTHDPYARGHDPYLWSIPMIHTSVIANPGHVLVLFLSCTYGVLQFVFHALRFEWGVRASYLMHVI